MKSSSTPKSLDYDYKRGYIIGYMAALGAVEAQLVFDGDVRVIRLSTLLHFIDDQIYNYNVMLNAEVEQSHSSTKVRAKTKPSGTLARRKET